MATYKELHGIAVQDVSSDPTTTGEIFYNSSTDTFRSVVQLQAWHSGTNMPATKGAAGAGGSGLVVIRYSGSARNSQGNSVVTTGGYTYHIYSATGSATYTD